VLVLLEDDDAGPLAHDEPVTVLVPRAAGAGRLGVAGRQRAGGAERRHAQPRQGGLEPPAIMTSAWSCWMKRAASPIALEPVAQAVATAVLGPLMWYRIETLPLAALAISRGR
jgi:hypothetical protein